MSYAKARNAYVTAAVQTVPPAQLLVMLYDGLLRNLDLAEVAVAHMDVQGAHTNLMKAQAIVGELDASLDAAVWSGASALKQLYQFVESELVEANISKDATRIASCRGLMAPLADAWRQAAVTATAQGATPGAPAAPASHLLHAAG